MEREKEEKAKLGGTPQPLSQMCILTVQTLLT
jgi:hypothetical protein